jgi:hypothetical protein
VHLDTSSQALLSVPPGIRIREIFRQTVLTRNVHNGLKNKINREMVASKMLI